MNRMASDMSVWFPVIEKLEGINVPQTVLITGKDQEKLLDVIDGDDITEFDNLCKEIRLAAEIVGYPFFLRTGQASNKHEWKNTCFVSSDDKIEKHVFNLIEFSECADMIGLPFSTWAVRKMLITDPIFHAFDGMPVTREFRVAIKDGSFSRIQPYWPPSVFCARYAAPTSENWIDKLRDISLLDDHTLETLKQMANTVGDKFKGYWSVDFLLAESKWWLIDMARGETSFWWDGNFDKDLNKGLAAKKKQQEHFENLLEKKS